MLKFIVTGSKKSLVVLLVFCLFSNFLVTSNAADDENKADLVINSIGCPNTMVEGEEINIIVKIENRGTKNVSQSEIIFVGLFVDYGSSPVSVNTSNMGLPEDKTSYINLSWTPDIGDGAQHILSVIVNYEYTIVESNYNNNAWDKTVSFTEKETDLEVIDIQLAETPYVNKKVNVIASIINKGTDTNRSIQAMLKTSQDDEIENVTKEDGLQRNEVFNFSFNWTPSHLGSQTLIVKLISDNEIQGSLEKTFFVNVSRLQWWDTSWHYRYFLVVEDEGFIGKSFNFTELLNGLDVFSQVFENDTITIVEYDKDGDIVHIVDNYNFNESDGFNGAANATGSLIWDSRSSSGEKYYCIYFDVENNPGVRTGLNETETIAVSGDAQITYSGFAEGWWAEIKQPTNGSYCFIDETKKISVVTSAEAVNVEAYIFLKENESYNFTVLLDNIDSGVVWEYDSFIFDAEGNWTIRVTGADGVDYFTNIEIDFYVGKPDIRLVNLSFSTDWAPTSPKIYKNDTVNITACLVSYYANIEKVNISFFIDEVEVENIVISVVKKDENNYVSFSWRPDEAGVYTINITVDPDNVTDELDEFNNQIIKKVTVYGLPDLEIQDIVLPSNSITELDKVRIDAVILNKGEGDALEYELGLYIEPARESTMTYSDKKTYEIINVSLNESKKVSLFWEPAEAGEWKVGVMILVSDAKRDLNIRNNRKVSVEPLIVRGFERNKPLIHDLDVQPDSQEQGGVVSIFAKVTDDSGLEYIKVTITNPKGVTSNGFMSWTITDTFRYDFHETSEDGLYLFKIKAVDISYYANNATAEGGFVINPDSTYPVVQFYDADPYIQLKKEEVQISCIASDNIGIKKVTVNIFPPGDSSFNSDMTLSSDGKYVYTDIYDKTGRYKFNIMVEDKAGLVTTTNNKTFWITPDLNDIDNDGMPNAWEKKHGLNPEYAPDADYDDDNDGYTNLEEYNMGTNPSKDIFIENAAYRFKENIWYIVCSIVLFFLVMFLSIYGMRRKKL